jgi:hypothetical protein
MYVSIYLYLIYLLSIYLSILYNSNQIQFENTPSNKEISTATKNERGGIMSCVGDINRMCSQEKRGGGALCTEDYSLWVAFNRCLCAYLCV